MGQTGAAPLGVGAVDGDAQGPPLAHDDDALLAEPHPMGPPADEPDQHIHDGDHIRLGNLDMECVETPGHTLGTISFFWNITQDGRTLRAGMMGGAGFNPGDMGGNSAPNDGTVDADYEVVDED